MAGQGEPYFVQRDNLGRATGVTYSDLTSTGYPEAASYHDYGSDGRVKQTSFVNTKSASDTTYGPEKYVVQFEYDAAGRTVRKVVRDTTASDATRFEESFEYDGMGRAVREKVLAWDATNERMVVRQDIRTTYDLGGNATQVKFYDNLGLAYTESRTYARGYQITAASFSDVRADVTVSTAGSYTYDTNNNMTATMKADAHITASGNQLSYLAAWTFTFDRKNRLTSFNYGTGIMNVWYDGMGRIWQRWQKIGLNWQATLSRNVYDQSSLVQEHTFGVSNQGGSWVYTYSDISRDYLRHPGGLRERQGGATSYDDYFQQGDSGRIDYRYKRNSAIDSVARVDRTRNMNQLSGGTFTDVSHLAMGGAYIESYGGGTGATSGGFDPLMTGGGHSTLRGFGVEPDVSVKNPCPRWVDVGHSKSHLGSGEKANPHKGSGGITTAGGVPCDCQTCGAWLEEHCQLYILGTLTPCTYWDLCCNPTIKCVAYCPMNIEHQPCDGNMDRCTELVCGKYNSPDNLCICGQKGLKKDPSDLMAAWDECYYCGHGDCCRLTHTRKEKHWVVWTCHYPEIAGDVGCCGHCDVTRYYYRRHRKPCVDKVVPYQKFNKDGNCDMIYCGGLDCSQVCDWKTLDCHLPEESDFMCSDLPPDVIE